MTLLADLERSISSIIKSLVTFGVADRLNMPSVRSRDRYSGDIGLSSNVDLSIVLNERPYDDLYDEMVRQRLFHVLFPDGGLLQFFYRVRFDKISKHRLAFYPCPYLRPFDADVLTYLRDSIWGHQVSAFHLPVVIRFDFEASEEKYVALSHSYSHLTLGQYPNCRIPVSSPLGPWIFTQFVMRNFYSKCFGVMRNIYDVPKFERSLQAEEKSSYFLSIPDFAH